MYRTPPTILFLICTVISLQSFAQIISVKTDSVSVTKPKPLKNLYRIETPDLQELEVSNKKPRQAETEPPIITRNLTGGAITLFSGITTGVTKTSLWVIDGELSGSKPQTNWRIPIFFQGTYIKKRDRVKNEDGSTSVDVKKGLEIDWNQESYGFIFENQDTIGFFTLIANVQQDPAYKWVRQLSEEGNAATRSLKDFTQGDGYSFVLKVAFRDQLITMVTNGSYFRTAILVNDIPVAVFQSNPTYLVLNKSARLNPYILFAADSGNQTRSDLMSLAIFNILIREIIAKDFYSL